MGGLFLRRGRVLESGRRGNFRIYDQSADCALLYAGFEHDGGSRARRTLRRVRNAWFGIAALLFTGDETGNYLEGKTDSVCFLGDQYRNVSGNHSEPFARRFDADLSIGQCRLLVSAKSEFMQTDVMQWFRWMRIVGDTIFALGAIVFCYFALDLMFVRKNPKDTAITNLVKEAA